MTYKLQNTAATVAAGTAYQAESHDRPLRHWRRGRVLKFMAAELEFRIWEAEWEVAFEGGLQWGGERPTINCNFVKFQPFKAYWIPQIPHCAFQLMTGFMASKLSLCFELHQMVGPRIPGPLLSALLLNIKWNRWMMARISHILCILVIVLFIE